MRASQQQTLGGLLILVGGLIYLLFRPTSLLLFHVADGLCLMPWIAWCRSGVVAWQPSAFVVYSLPEGLWAAAYMLLVHGLTVGQNPLVRLAVASTIPLTGLVTELLQLSGLVPGRFDWADVLCYATPPLLLYLYELIKTIRIWESGLTVSTAGN